MDSVFEVHSRPLESDEDVSSWIRGKVREIVADVEMFKRSGVVRDYWIVSADGMLDVRGVFRDGTVFALRVSFMVEDVSLGKIVFCDVSFSWVSPHEKTRRVLRNVRDLGREFRSVKFNRAFSEKEGASILVRWDNKPYHSEAGSWPFHKHFGGRKVPASRSQEQSVGGFFEFVKVHLGR
ncbi:hypothetical protein TK1377 [Thermococcus kodakarensis KOD1]|uniref:Uncharacterized protein n=1 Tax=Thermococcus kodakarensis (strain ATCC BAA-918 / JCM 12380 / KOD1) TaxID=69014 RepID=Q5JGX8_THEKO|nr:hypothetical protein [Thermococcus kodakarensis]WCN27356.1 hypothetical protein POG15_06995 [Thermococcus kodakarensis]WCN29645.1 hypothetical protein POG21_06990 [Thermococcus kodakarensis]BAD85566.1 hypothetical protein TK1377 [Thermococcus kodakarensis KOD1]